MSLMTLVRLFAALVLAWTLVALGIGATGSVPVSHRELLSPRAEPPMHGALPDLGPGVNRHDLVDLTTGRSTPLHLPEEDRWTIASVSPWRDSSGDLEIVGRWVSPGEGAFCGMGSFRLSDGAVISRVPLEMLPTGHACCVPGQERTILFPAGDGKLYRCQLPAREVVAGLSIDSESGSTPISPIAVTWKAPVPGVGGVLLSDPIWSSDSRLRKWVIVSLSDQARSGPNSSFEASKIWWLEMNDQADSILAAGRLTAPASSAADVQEQLPNVAAGPDGTVRLVYLSRRKGSKSARLHAAELRFDPATGRPFLASDRGETRLVSDGLATAPLLASADGTKVFGRENGGRIRMFNLMGHAD
ncbi:MAG: hypothetical protein ACLQGP_12515 [Isosphaeraceae bacterium]